MFVFKSINASFNNLDDLILSDVNILIISRMNAMRSELLAVRNVNDVAHEFELMKVDLNQSMEEAVATRLQVLQRLLLKVESN